MASGVLDADMIPALAVVIKAAPPAIESKRKPANPATLPAPSEIGISETENSSQDNIPAVLNKVTRYRIVTTKNAENIPRGIVFPGSLISSAMDAIFVNPPNEMKITEEV